MFALWFFFCIIVELTCKKIGNIEPSIDGARDQPATESSAISGSTSRLHCTTVCVAKSSMS
ncbi:unnamed protein product [Albugo candida]|uniref:Uncharacterized protein n=1 Tax=Albugo candida TaxID=65357 RepID=A0A024GEI0_9STRA|nr:unnamed protein product [Albugo candida]|eukprot:CCI44890.1 unnamed protein product [Albugo candida]